MNKETTDKVKLALIQQDLSYIKANVDDIKDKMEKDYVTQEEFKPIKRFIDIIQGLIITGVIGALLALVIKK
jgi:tetrahydromethanopterin S-methyltransferase subunit G